MQHSNDDVDQIQTFDDENPPLQFGSKRLYYQYSVSIPQIQLVLASVLQGIVFTLLLTKTISLPNPIKGVFILFQLPYLFQFFQQQYFYLPYILTSLVILIAWMDLVYASAVLIWPPTTLQAGFVYLLTVAQVIMVNTVSPESFSVWRSALGLTTVIGGLVRCNNVRIFTINDFEDTELGDTILRREKKYGISYIILGSLGIGFGLSYPFLLTWVQGKFPQLNDDAIIHWVLYLIVLAELSGALAVDIKNRQELLHKLTKKTNLEVTKHGGIRQRSTLKVSNEGNVVAVLQKPSTIIVNDGKSSLGYNQQIVNILPTGCATRPQQGAKEAGIPTKEMRADVSDTEAHRTRQNRS